jgi:signal transduction histidine kinase
MKRTALTIWFAAAAVLVAADAYVCYVNVRKMIDNARLVAHSRDIVSAADRVLSSLKDAEAGQRGYLITGDPKYLAPYEEAAGKIHGQLDVLARLIADDPDEQARFASLREAVSQRLAILQQVIGARRRGGFEAAQAMVREGRGLGAMQDARRLVEEVRASEEHALARHDAQREASAATATATLISSGVFNLFLLAMIAYVVRRDMLARARAADEQRHKVELERDNLRLSADVEERRRMNESLTALTQRLEQSNRELQDFASVASHDLQEPLRKIQAFGDRLRNRFAGQLGTDGRDYVDRMHAAASRMQTLINDLLAFARVTTKAHPFAPVDLNAVVRDVLSDLEARVESSGGKVEVGELPTVDADAFQVRQLFQNLIANALKFRKPDAPPLVRITSSRINAGANGDGAATVPPMHEIRIADNGIGFDEKYLDRIFNVFQRLHGRAEYEGTGIGLAVCRKIVERHGGTITAQSREGEGSTFVVVLPERQQSMTQGDARDADVAEANAAATSTAAAAAAAAKPDRHPVGR